MPMKSPFPINGTSGADERRFVQQRVAKHEAGKLVPKSSARSKGRSHTTGADVPTRTPTRKAS